MALPLSTVDLYWTNAGDFKIDPDTGDLATAAGNDPLNPNTGRLMLQAINKRLMSSYGDWPLLGNYGANFVDFAGQPNTRETAAAIKSRIVYTLTGFDPPLVAASQLQIELMPLSNTSILIILIVSGVLAEGQLELIFSYDMRDNKLVPRNL
jgi:hypothetical protein